ncbi:transmembrane protein 238-like [Rhincodon typus]|uniref:transmembrane protein 238-like n=1 Tax=Rhincodon typus TaxID=259920 RepID=UPI002030E2FC|nr:transmembrane protein 238-like [Rhincodon typus]
MALLQAALGRCACAFWLAVAFDAVGLTVLLIGVFANIFFYDFLIYAGSIVIFLSLIWWIFWYTGNIEVPQHQLEDDVGLKDRMGFFHRWSSRISTSLRRVSRRSASMSRSRSSGHRPSNLTEEPVKTLSESVNAALNPEQRESTADTANTPL